MLTFLPGNKLREIQEAKNWKLSKLASEIRQANRAGVEIERARQVDGGGASVARAGIREDR